MDCPAAKFVHSKYKYEIECPEEKKRRVSLGETTSSRKGFVRFQPDAVKDLVSEMENLDQAKKDGLVRSGDKVVAIHGMQEELSGYSHLMKVLDVV